MYKVLIRKPEGNMKFRVFWDVAPQGPDDGGSMNL
jgi:hypothetical protein